MWALGGKVRRGKVYGQWQGLSRDRLHEGRDLSVTTDYRAVLSPVLERHLSLDRAKLKQVFPGYTPDRRIEIV